ncbi:MAG: ribosome silencing factor [Deltaproteobacteria bacterium]|nr:ribosome silencing factor [Deltaproteobacteria bacterium]
MKKVHKDFQDVSSLELARFAALAALDKKAEDLVVLDVRGLSSFTDFFVIMSGRSTRHVQGLAQAVDAALRHKNVKDGNTEGLNEGHWVLLDYNDVIVHIFYNEDRSFYDIEGLWHDAPRVEIEPEAVVQNV